MTNTIVVDEAYLLAHPELGDAALGTTIEVPSTDIAPVQEPQVSQAEPGVKEIKLPSGRMAQVEKFSGYHVKLAQGGMSQPKEGDQKPDEKEMEDGLLWNLICLCVTIEGKRVTPADADEMPGADFLMLLGEFSSKMKETEGKQLADTEAGLKQKMLPSGAIAVYEQFKGKHVKEAVRQQGANDKPGNILWIIMSRFVHTVDGNDLFPEDIDAMNGQDVLVLMGEFSAASFRV